MADSAHVQVADAIVAELNSSSRDWSGAFTAERSWLPVYKPDELSETRVAVVPLSMEQEKLSRAKNEFTFSVPISIQRKVDVADKETLDSLDKLAQDIHDFFRSEHRLADMTDWLVFEATRPAVFALERLWQERTWETMIDVRVRGWRS